MGSLVWILNLWSMRLAAGAAVLATMSAAVAMYQRAEDVTAELEAATENTKQDAASVWALLD